MQIGFVLFPNVTQLDFTGPAQVLSRLPDARVHVLAKTGEAVPTDCAFSILPTGALADAPKLDLLCVPGGFGVAEAFEDAETLDYVRKAASEATYVTSVCTGAFLLGAAGLLRGKRATTHWAYHDLLPRVGAIPEPARVVRDGSTITGGGVTAGIDFALTVAAEVAGERVAQRIQLALEYDPAPPFPGGSPASAHGEITDGVRRFYQPRLAEFADRLSQALA